MISRREIIKMVVDGEKQPYVPWSFKFTVEPKEMLLEHFKAIKKQVETGRSCGGYITSTGSPLTPIPVLTG
jgi:hypothetical protein